MPPTDPPIAIAPGDLVLREHHDGVWRVLGLEERVFRRGDYLPLGARYGDPAPPHAIIERVTQWDLTPPPTTGRGHSARRAGAPICNLKRLTRGDIDALIGRALAIRDLLPG